MGDDMNTTYEKSRPRTEPTPVPAKRSFNPGDIVRMPHYETVGVGRFRVWVVEGVNLGGVNQEGTYQLRALDVLDNCPIHVPCIMLETHPLVERI